MEQELCVEDYFLRGGNYYVDNVCTLLTYAFGAMLMSYYRKVISDSAGLRREGTISSCCFTVRLFREGMGTAPAETSDCIT
jgi:hypothetical protein